MQLAVHSEVAAVDVVEGPRREQGVVERRVEGRDVAPAPAPHPDRRKRPVPAPAGRRGETAIVEPALLGGEVLLRAGDADERDPDLHLNAALMPGVEAGVGARLRGVRRVGRDRSVVGCRGRAGAEGLPLPGPVSVEGAVEAGREVDPVAGPLGAEEAAGGRAGDLRRRGVDLDVGVVVGIGAAAGVDHHAGMWIARKGEACQPGTGARRQPGLDPVPVPVQLHAV